MKHNNCKDEIYEALTIQGLRIVEMMRNWDCDADTILQEFIGEVGEYEKKLAKREGIVI